MKEIAISQEIWKKRLEISVQEEEIARIIADRKEMGSLFDDPQVCKRAREIMDDRDLCGFYRIQNYENFQPQDVARAYVIASLEVKCQ